MKKIISYTLILWTFCTLALGQNSPINLVENAQTGMKKENLGSSINSGFSETAPLISPDGKMLFFSRGGHPHNIGDSKQQDIWYAELQKDGTWGAAKNIGSPLNNDAPNYVASISPDGKAMLVGNLYKPDGSYGGSGMSITYLTERGWAIPKPVIIRNYYTNATEVSYRLSIGQNVLLLSLARDDSFGSNDLYVSFILPDSTWSEPKNLGSLINTLGEESAPFLAADNTTLYFASNGRPGYGETDVFITHRLDDTWMNWSEPQNLGPEVNGKGTDLHYTISVDGDFAYTVSTEHSFGDKDIFRIATSAATKPKPVVLVYGKVSDDQTQLPLGSSIEFASETNNQLQALVGSDAKDGSFKAFLPAGQKYQLKASAQGYAVFQELLDVSETNAYREVEMNIQLASLQKMVAQKEVSKQENLQQTTHTATDKVYTSTNYRTDLYVPSVFFDPNTAQIDNYGQETLAQVLDFLVDNPTFVIEIQGHTDNVGSTTDNNTLSEQRALQIKQYLIARKIPENRLIVKSFGAERPSAPNDSPEGRLVNRRVEFKVLKQ